MGRAWKQLWIDWHSSAGAKRADWAEPLMRLDALATFDVVS